MLKERFKGNLKRKVSNSNTNSSFKDDCNSDQETETMRTILVLKLCNPREQKEPNKDKITLFYFQF
jgi:hypothetical protein